VNTTPAHRAYIQSLLKRPDAKELYVHGSREVFTRFRTPDVNGKGQLIFFSQLVEPYLGATRPLQAEYYGEYLYVCKLDKGKPFNPYNDPIAKGILAGALPLTTYDRENKIKWGRVDYQDLYEIAPPAVKAGYNRFSVYEISMQGVNSVGISDPKLITLITRSPNLLKVPMSTQWLTKLTADEREKLFAFVGGGGEHHRDAIARMLSKASPYAGTVYRGIPDMGYTLGLPTTVGSISAVTQMLSATKLQKTANDFVRGRMGVWADQDFPHRSNERGLFTLRVRTAADISTEDNGEHEVLIRPGTRFRCTRTHQMGKTHMFALEEV
jgi:hypothetical protein